jgi:hypothetical protein
MEPWCARKSTRTRAAATLGPVLVHHLLDPSTIQYYNSNNRGPSSSRRHSPPCKAIEPYNVSSSNAPMHSSLLILEVKMCNGNRSLRGERKTSMMESASIVAREDISQELAPSHVTISIRHLQPIKLTTTVATLLP